MPLFIHFVVKKKNVEKSGNKQTKQTIKQYSVKNGLKFHDDEPSDDPSNIDQNPDDEHFATNNPIEAAANCEEKTGSPQFDLSRNQDNTIVNKKMVGKECELSVDSSTDQIGGLVAPPSTPNQHKSIEKFANASQSLGLGQQYSTQKEMAPIEI